MNPFRIACTTCHARLKITDPAAIGQILACPKCGSMVQATPPEGWSADGPALADSQLTIPVAAKSSAGAARVQPPPLPTSAAASATATPPVDLAIPAEAGSRWFWPALSGATVLSLAIAAWLIYLDRKNHPAEVAATETTAPQDKPVTAPVPVSKATDHGLETRPAVADKPAAATAAKVVEPAPAVTPAPADAPAHAPVAATGPATAENHGSSVPAVVDKPATPPTDATPAAATAPPAPTRDLPPAGGAAADPHANKAPAVAPDAVAADPAAARPVRPSVERIPPRIVDVETRLTDPFPGVSYHDIPLVQLLADLSQFSTIPMSLDADALAEMELSPEMPVSVRLSDTTIGGVLDEVLGPRGLSYSVVNHQLLIGRPRQGELRRVRYGVPDLAGDTVESKAQFAALVHAMIEPASWKEAGGAAVSRWDDRVLAVEQSESAHAQLLVFCEKLRVARGLPLRSKIDPARFRLEPRSKAAKPALAQPVTVNYNRPEPLTRILAYLHNATKVTLLIDQAALADQRMAAETEGLLTVDHQPLGQALTALLEPMDLTWRVVGERAIEITTPQAAARHGEVEFYPAGELLSGDLNGDALAARIQRELASGAASDSTMAKPTIQFDAASRCLIVRAPQSVQLRVASLLSGLRVARQ